MKTFVFDYKRKTSKCYSANIGRGARGRWEKRGNKMKFVGLKKRKRKEKDTPIKAA